MKSRLCIVGPLVGVNTGRVTTPGERLAELLAQDGYSVVAVSNSPNRYVRLLDIIWTLIRLGRKVDVQVLQVYSGASFVVEDIASLLGKVFGHKIVMIMHGGNLPTFMAHFPRWTERVLKRADAIIAPSAYLARTMRKHGYSCAIIPNIIDLQSYPYPHRAKLRPKLFWMRAFEPDIYNPAMAIRVLAQLKRTIPDATLVMAGQHGPAERDMQRLAAELGVGDAVEFVGFLDGPGKARAGEAADIFINTNYVDNMPVCIIEAFAMGMPVVATNVGGIADLITHGETGMLVTVDDDDAMTEAILRLLREPTFASRLAENGRKLAERCVWEVTGPQLEQLIQRTVEAA